VTDTLRQQLVSVAQDMNRVGLNQGRSGNLSVRHGGSMLVTPSGLAYEEMDADDIVLLGLDEDGDARGSGRKPSSEWRIHRDVYRERPDAAAILHAHPVHCTALAALRRGLPSFHYMVAVAGGRDIRCADYATFGTQALSDHVLAALAGRHACLMANHGLLCLAADLPAALALAVEVEALARSYLLALAAGEPVLLDGAEMDRVLEKFKGYGQR